MKSKKIGNYITHGLLYIIVVFFFVVIVQNLKIYSDSDYIPSIFGYTYLNVLSESMRPELKSNDLIIGKKLNSAEGLDVGDVITYKDNQLLVTHRIISVNDDGSFVTKGDANNVEDKVNVTESMIISDYSFKIPYMGYVISKLQNPMFLLLLWIIVMYFIITELIKEVKRIKKNKINDTNNHQ